MSQDDKISNESLTVEFTIDELAAIVQTLGYANNPSDESARVTKRLRKLLRY